MGHEEVPRADNPLFFFLLRRPTRHNAGRGLVGFGLNAVRAGPFAASAAGSICAYRQVEPPRPPLGGFLDADRGHQRKARQGASPLSSLSYTRPVSVGGSAERRIDLFVCRRARMEDDAFGRCYVACMNRCADDGRRDPAICPGAPGDAPRSATSSAPPSAGPPTSTWSLLISGRGRITPSSPQPPRVVRRSAASYAGGGHAGGRRKWNRGG